MHQVTQKKSLGALLLLLIACGGISLHGMQQAKTLPVTEVQLDSAGDMAHVATKIATLGIADLPVNIVTYALLSNQVGWYLACATEDDRIIIKRIWSLAHNCAENVTIVDCADVNAEQSGHLVASTHDIQINDEETTVSVNRRRWQIREGKIFFDAQVPKLPAVNHENLVWSRFANCMHAAEKRTTAFGLTYQENQRIPVYGTTQRNRCYRVSPDKKTAIFALQNPLAVGRDTGHYAVPLKFVVWQKQDALLVAFQNRQSVLPDSPDMGYEFLIKGEGFDLRTVTWDPALQVFADACAEKNGAIKNFMKNYFMFDAIDMNDVKDLVLVPAGTRAVVVPAVVTHLALPVPPAAAHNQNDGYVTRFKTFIFTNANKHKKLMYFCASVAGALVLRYLYNKRKQQPHVNWYKAITTHKKR